MATNIHQGISDRDAAEWRFLQSLCAAALPWSQRLQYCERARVHIFANIAHRTIFEELCAVSGPDRLWSANELRNDLPARATRRGFPDLDFASLLADSELTEQAASDSLKLAWQQLIKLQ